MVAARDADDERTSFAPGSELLPDSQDTFTRAELAPLLHELHAARTALRAQEERLTLALDAAETGLWDWDPVTDRLTWTPQMERLYGVEDGTVDMYEAWRSRVHPDDIAQAEAERDAALRERRPFCLEFRIVLPSGELRWLSARGLGHYDDAGKLLRVTGSNQDITRRKADEAERSAAHARLAAQWESTPIASFLWKKAGEDLTLVEVNPAAERLSRGKAHEFLGMTATQIYPDRPDILEHLRTCLAQQSVTRLESEYRARGTGQARTIDFTFAFVAPDCVLLHAEDVTDLRRAEETQRFAQTVVDSMSDAALWTTEDGRYVYANKAAHDLLGCADDELLACHVYDFLVDVDAMSWAARWRTLQERRTVRRDVPHRRKNGTIIQTDMQVQMVQYGGRDYACAILRDISERKSMEETLRASEAKFASLFAMSPVALSITRANDRVFLDLNSAFTRLTGYTRDDMVGHSALDRNLYVVSADRTETAVAFQREGEITSRPLQVRTRNGELVDCLISARAVEIDGSPCILAGIVDVGTLRQAEVALRASEARFASLFEMSPISMTITRAADGVFVDANSAALQAIGYTREEFLGRTSLDLGIYPNYDDRTTMKAAIVSDGGVNGWNIQLRAKNGDVHECLMSVSTVTIEGEPHYLSGIVDVDELRQTEAALRTQQAAMLAMLENTDGSIWSIDRAYRLTACNSAFRRDIERALGSEPAIGESIFQWSDSQADADEWRGLYDRALAGERLAVDAQRRYLSPGNWAEYRFNPVRDAGGEVTGVTVLGRDITERRRARAQIEAQLAEISLYFDTAPAGLAVLDSDLRFLRINNLLAAMNGIPAEEHIGRTVEEIVPLIADQARRIAATILTTGEPVTDIEIVGETAADPGVTHTWREHWYPIKRGDGAIIGFNVTAEDITERKRTRELLERSQQNLARAQEIGRLGSWEWDVPNERLEWSDELYRIFGVDRRFVPTYAGIEAMIHPDDRAFDNAKVQEMLAAGDGAEFEVRIVQPDGDIRHIYENIEILRDAAGAPLKLFGVVQDITERKVAEDAREQLQAQLAQAQKMETVGRLAGGIAHDFNNLLAVILLRTEMAQQMVAADTPLRRSLDTIYSTAQRSANLVQQLLGYARKQTIAPRVIDLNAAVESLLPVLDKLIGEEIELAWTPGGDLWPVKMDAAQVDQILTNLCVNARDAIDGIGTIAVKTANVTFAATAPDVASAPPGEYVLLSVTDSGRGMEPSVLEHIFEPFFTTKGVGKGVGLGLATVDGIVGQNGGRIVVTSKAGAGTTFAIYLPRHTQAVATPSVKPPRVGRDGAGKTVLVAEDEASVLNMAAEVLRQYGYTVLAAGSPVEALRLVEEHAGPIDLLLTDVIMPVMNGAELAARVRQLRPALKTLYMSGYPADHVVTRGVLVDDAHFLAKPFSVQMLAGKVEEILS